MRQQAISGDYALQLTLSGLRVPIGDITKVPAKLITGSVAHCPLARSDSAQQTVTVAVSNDGINLGTVMLFTAHDPRCYSCQPSTHQCTRIVSNL